MKNYLMITILILIMIFCIGCDTRYSYATMTIINNSTHKMIYKGLVRDEMSGDATGDWIIRTIMPNYSPLYPDKSDTLSHTWKDGYDSILFALCWGLDTTSDYKVYDNTMDYIEVYDGENVTLTVSGTTAPSITRNRL